VKNRKTMIVALALFALVVATVPAGAKKPDNPGKPGSGPTSPTACEMTSAFWEDSRHPTEAREYTDFWIKLDLGAPVGQDLCVEVTVASGNLSDMNVALVDYHDPAARRCGFYWPGGKINEGDVFNVRFSLDGYTGQDGFCGSEPDSDTYPGLVVLVMPKLHPKTDEATLEVRIGFVDVAP